MEIEVSTALPMPVTLVSMTRSVNNLLNTRGVYLILGVQADDNRVPVSLECWGRPLIGCNVNAMTQIISGVVIGE